LCKGQSGPTPRQPEEKFAKFAWNTPKVDKQDKQDSTLYALFLAMEVLLVYTLGKFLLRVTPIYALCHTVKKYVLLGLYFYQNVPLGALHV
jgi:hypothetical protein